MVKGSLDTQTEVDNITDHTSLLCCFHIPFENADQYGRFMIKYDSPVYPQAYLFNGPIFN